MSTTRHQTFKLKSGLGLAYDVSGPAAGQPVVFLHGFGQTRHAWGKAATVLAQRGFRAYTVDLRGHGASGWADEGNYEIEHYTGDTREFLAGLGRPAALVGASLGGISALLASGEEPKVPVKCLVLVDITSRVSEEGVTRIQEFMEANLDGFASIEEAADSVSRYLPNRPPPKNFSGLMKNLRKAVNGRLYWHWDPAALRQKGWDNREAADHRIEQAARGVEVPTLLLRGGNSELVSPEAADTFLKLFKHGELAAIDDAHHMVAGDKNDDFTAALVEFVGRYAG